MKNFLKDFYWFMFERGGFFASVAVMCLLSQLCSPFGSKDYFACMICFTWSVILAYVAPMKRDIEKIKEKIDRNK